MKRSKLKIIKHDPPDEFCNEVRKSLNNVKNDMAEIDDILEKHLSTEEKEKYLNSG